jgi:predicted phage terminase large subunit-like protein
VPSSAARSRPPATRDDFAASVEGSLAFLQPAAAPIIERRPETSLREHIRAIWPIIEPGTKFVDGWHIGAVSEHLQACSMGQIQYLILAFPPRSMKSITLAVGWPTWEWTWIPYIRQIFNSHTAALSTRDSVKCRRVIESRWYQRRFGHVFQLTTDQNQKTRFENDRAGYRIAGSVGGAGGTGEGGDRIVVDDAHKVNEANSTVKREAAVTWWRETMASRRNDPKTAVRVVSGQRVHEADVTGEILARELGPYAYSAQYQQEPTPAKGAVFEIQWFKWYTLPKIRIVDDFIVSPELTIRKENVVEFPPAVDEMIQSVDASFKGKTRTAASRGTDFFVDQAWARRQADVFILGEERGQWELPASIAAVRKMSAEYPKAKKKLIEDKANGPAIVSTLRHELGGLIEVDPEKLGGDLVARARAASPFVAAGNVYLPHPKIAPWILDWLNEMVKFPRAAFDDRVAAAVQAILILQESVKAMSWRNRQGEKKGPTQAAAVTKRKY